MKKASAGLWALAIILGAAFLVFPAQTAAGGTIHSHAPQSSLPCCHLSVETRAHPVSCHSSAEKVEFSGKSTGPRSPLGFGCCCAASENEPCAVQVSHFRSHASLVPLSPARPNFSLCPAANRAYFGARVGRLKNVPLYLRNVSLLY